MERMQRAEFAAVEETVALLDSRRRHGADAAALALVGITAHLDCFATTVRKSGKMYSSTAVQAAWLPAWCNGRLIGARVFTTAGSDENSRCVAAWAPTW